MASATPEDVTLDTEIECPVCLQTCIHPVRLPCSHIFCFLCIKGVANQSKRCAMCRQEIPADFLENPDLLERPKEPAKEEEGEYHWFYEGRGRNGWWQYDERTSQDLEKSYISKEKTCEVLVAGFLYVIDFEKMLQRRRNDPNLRRRIKRDFSSADKKGVAGIKSVSTSSTEAASAVLPNPPFRGSVPSTDTTYSPCDNDDDHHTPRTEETGGLDDLSTHLQDLSVGTNAQYYPLDDYDSSPDPAEQDFQ